MVSPIPLKEGPGGQIRNKIQWVWMDLDDTLIDFKANSRAALTKLYAYEELSKWYPTVKEWVAAYEKVNKPLWRQYSAGEIPMEKLRLERFLVPLLSGGMEEGEALSRAQRYDTYYLDLLAQEKLTLPYAHEIMRRLRAKGYRLGVLSNGFTEVQHRKIASAGLTGLIDLVVLSDEIGFPKPDGRLFRYAMERAGSPDPERHLMVGDNLDTDVRGALSSGWSAICFNPSSTVVPETVVSVPSLMELDSLL